MRAAPQDYVPQEISVDQVDAPADQGVDQPDDSTTKRQYRRDLREARRQVTGLEAILCAWEASESKGAMGITHDALRELLAAHFPLIAANTGVRCIPLPASTHEPCPWVGQEVGASGEQEWAEHVAQALLDEQQRHASRRSPDGFNWLTRKGRDVMDGLMAQRHNQPDAT